MPGTHVSIVILTAKRPDKLFACLESLEKQIFKTFEVIIVDNAPSEKTEEIAEEFDLKTEIVQNYEVSSYAESRNLGVRASSGEFIAFIDDDCVADPAWLENLVKDCEKNDASGGMVLPFRNLPFPDWWDNDLNWMLGLSVPGMLGTEAGSVHYPQTANMMIRRKILDEQAFQEIGGGFTQKKSGKYAGREDVELWRRLRVSGKKCSICLRAIVYHDIPENRINFKYLMQRSFNDGLAYYRREEKKDYLSWAAGDLVRFIPGLFKASISGKKNIKRVFASSTLWHLRQIGFIYAYISSGFISLRLFDVFLRIFKESGNYLTSTVKKSLRKIFVRYRKSIRGKRKIPEKPGTLLIAACGFLGDMILLAPVLQSLRNSLPDTDICLLTYRRGRILFENSGLVNNIVECPSEEDGIYKYRKKILSERLAGHSFDAVMISYYHKAPPEPLYFDLNAPVIVFDRDIGFSRQIWYDLADLRIRKDFSEYETINLFNLAKVVGAREIPRPYQFHIPADVEKHVNDLIVKSGIDEKNFVLLHPGAGSPEKMWPENYWSEFITRLYNKFNITPVFFGDEKTSAFAQRIIFSSGVSSPNLCGKIDIMGLAALTKKAGLLIINDSGPKHFAVAYGTPSLCLYGHTDERRWGALWDRNIHYTCRGVSKDLTQEELLGLPPDYAMRCIKPEHLFSMVSHIFARRIFD
jgi:ADP-heptose:LPS heptosyltransferase/GT2 family glycosyltransferase